MTGRENVALSSGSNPDPHSPQRLHPRIVCLKYLKLRSLVFIGATLLACSQSERRAPVPLDPPGLVEQGKLRLANGDANRAIASFRTALLQDSSYAEAMAGLSRAYGLQKRVDLAQIYLRRASATSYQVGIAALEGGDDERAETAFNHTLDLTQRHPLALIRLGEIAVRRGERNRAVELFERAAEANPGYAESFVRLGHVHALQRDPEKARAAYERAIEVNINSPDAYMGLGDLLSSEAKWAAASEQYDKVLLIDPQSQAAKTALKRVRNQL